MDIRKENSLTKYGVQLGTGIGAHINIHHLSFQNFDQ